MRMYILIYLLKKLCWQTKMFQRIVQTLKHHNAKHKHYNYKQTLRTKRTHSIVIKQNSCFLIKNVWTQSLFLKPTVLTTILIWKEKKTAYNKQMCEQNSCFETKMSQKSCFKTKCENKTFASKPKCFLKNLASKLKCLNTSLILKPNVWTKHLLPNQIFFWKTLLRAGRDWTIQFSGSEPDTRNLFLSAL